MCSLRARPDSRCCWRTCRLRRLIATLGIVLMTFGLYVPVAGRDLLIEGDPLSRSSETWTTGNSLGAPLALLHIQGMSLPLQLGIDVVYSMLTWGGLALIPLLWRSLSARGTAVVRWTYAAWLLLLTLLVVACLPAWHAFMTQPPQGSPKEDITLAGSYLLPGAVVFPLGVLVGCVALALMLLALMLRESLPAAAPASAPRTRWQWAAALVLTAGVLVWIIGFYIMPEVTTTECPPVIFSVTQFARGACAGLDSDQVLALIVALVALQGVGVIVQHGFKFTFDTGPNWHVGPGMIVTVAGIGLVALGQFGLWRELVRRKAMTSAQ